ncbi:MAG: MarR family transcriptional regulator [Bacteroidales bacterium]|nr:MarR family transcriptional regulator [Bacteroidales bacterium]
MIQKGLREHIEITGRVFEKFGLTPMQGRIMAYFANSGKPEATFAELLEFFRASKSSISTSLNYLLSIKLIDYRTYASERKKYFYITDGFFKIYFMQLLDNVQELKNLCYKTISMRTSEYPEVSEKILKWIEGGNIFEEAIKATIDNIKKTGA